MKGFFSLKESKSTAKGKPLSCFSCGLARNCSHPKMEMAGRRKLPVLHIGEAPGRHEDIKGEQFIGAAGKLYNECFEDMTGRSIHDGYKTNSCRCRPIHNATPTAFQVECCRKKLFKDIKEFSENINGPGVIFLVGGIAVEAVLGNYLTEGPFSISRWRGFHIPFHEYNCWLVPIFHPSHVSRKSTQPQFRMRFEKDIKAGFNLIGKELPPPILETQIRKLYDDKKISKVLRRILKIKPPYLAFDYETTGLKPDREGHEIYCVSICYSPEFAYSFSIKDISKENLKLFLDILRDPAIGKVAQNAKFEDRWTRSLLHTRIHCWAFDTMLAAHILDNRPYTTGLKFNATARLGVWEYDKSIKKFLEGRGDRGANNFNRIADAPFDELLQYCGMDALIEYRLAIDMMKEIGFG